MSMTIGERLRSLRETNKLTQEEVANQLEVSRQVISKWELNKSLPDLNQIAILAKCYKVSLDELILGREAVPSENFQERLQHEWNDQVNAFPLITLEDYWLKGPNLQLTQLGKESQLQMTLLETLASGQVVGTVFLIEGDYFPTNTIGNNGPKCQIEVTHSNLILSEFNHYFIGWRSWPTKIPEVMTIDYDRIESVYIGIERRTGKVWGLMPNGQPYFYLLVDVFLKTGEHWVFSCASLNSAPRLLEFLSKQQLDIKDVFGLKDLFKNPQISEPSTFIKENYDQLLPAIYRGKYDLTLR